jgi:predicted nucleic acid-binding protein
VNVLFDTNVVLDVLLEREAHVGSASKLFALVDNGRVSGSICATTATTISYIATKALGRRKAREQIHGLLCLFEVAPVDGKVLEAALALDFTDYEDAVLHESARAFGANLIVTRDRSGFANSLLPALAPDELLAMIAAWT